MEIQWQHRQFGNYNRYQKRKRNHMLQTSEVVSVHPFQSYVLYF